MNPTRADPLPDPFDMDPSDLALEVSQLRHFADEAKELVAMVGEETGEDAHDVNARLAARLAGKERPS